MAGYSGAPLPILWVLSAQFLFIFQMIYKRPENKFVGIYDTVVPSNTIF